MKNRYIVFLVLVSLLCLLSISAISATEDTNEVISTDNNQDLILDENIQEDVSQNSNENELNFEENNGDILESGTDNPTLSETPLTFTQLNDTINGNTNNTIYLLNDYKYKDSSDVNFKNGISIDRDLTIYGNGVTLNGIRTARIFNVTNLGLNVKFYNINFIYGKAVDGGAIYGGSAYDCTFTENSAIAEGGAIYKGNAINCTFTQNRASDGGAIYFGNATNCTFSNNTSVRGGATYHSNAYNSTFIGNNAKYGEAMYYGNAILCRFKDNWNSANIIPATINVFNFISTYQSGEKLKFNLIANNTQYDGFNTTIEIYKDNLLFTTVYGLTGEGWIVDLDPGVYTAVLSLTSYPNVNKTNTTINILNENEDNQNSAEEGQIVEDTTTHSANTVSPQKTIKCKIDTAYFKENNNNLRLHLWLRGPDYMLIGGVKLKIHETYKGKSKDYYVKTLGYNQKEKIFKHLGVGTHKFVIKSMNSKYQASTTIRVTIPKKTVRTIIIKGIGKGYKTAYRNIRPDSSLSFYREIKQSPSTEKLYVELWHPYVSKQPYKITKVQYFFKNAYNGKIIKRTVRKVYRSGLIYYTRLKIPAWYYKPMSAKVWYKPI